jgi:saccharopine dehydrogenase-like NADP-dependent oxidoreductase
MKTVLIVGATGVFGQRLAKHVSSFDGIRLVLTSRDLRKAQALCSEIENGGAAVSVEALAFDKAESAAAMLATVKPFTVIDASGPFQHSDFSFARAVIAAGAHYLDLADARDYLVAFSELDNEAKASGVTALAGTSSTPGLSSAAVAHLTQGWQRVDMLDMVITPGGKSDVGPAVLQAILSYAGTGVETFSDGRLAHVTAWVDSCLQDISGLGRRRVVPVETADARLLSEHFQVQSRVRFQAGLESPIEQWGMIFLSRLRQFGLLKSLDFLGPVALKARALTKPFTTDRGAMVVEAAGLDEAGQPVRVRWSLLAQKGDGPHVPTLPAAAALRGLLAGEFARGARPCVAALSLEAIEREMERYAISTLIKIG